MKKWGFFIVILLLLGGVVIKFIPLQTEGDNEASDSRPDSNTFEMITKSQVYKGNLLLVNKDYPLEEQGTLTDIVKLSDENDLMTGYGLMNTKLRLSRMVAEAFVRMVQDAAKDGVNHFLLSSGYRDFSEQEKLYKEKGGDSALPAGRSEHNLGLSLDIGSSKSEMSRAPEGKWLKENAWKYGFILRYPEDKTAITGIKYEPWHFRYVGLPHSAIMQKKHMVLEQYIDYLREHGSYTEEVDGQSYEVLYYPVKKNVMIRIPANRRYEISGNNVDGIIVTLQK